jgi:neurotransmitter:Na+ symporter, NSS family
VAGPRSPEGGEGGRELFGTKAGFILAAVGSAVGLGNMWRFSYQASEGGGAAFVLLYVIMTLVLGIPLLLAELSIGRNGRLSPIGSLRKLGGEGWSRMGYLFVLAGLLILAYYSVIAGWTVRYAFESALTGFPGSPAEHFGEVAAGPQAVAFHLGFMVLTIAVVMGGIRGGIERASIILMPILFLIVVGLAIWAGTLEGAGAGYAAYLRPDLSELRNPDIFRAAAAQAFFSLSLGMGAMLTFASYLRKDQDLPQESTIIAFSDFGVAFVAGLVVFPVIASLGLQSQVSESTVGALFIALPGAFESMGTVGHVVGVFFFTALAVGALTSAISLLEVVTASVIDEFGISRRTAALGAGGVIAVLGIPPALNTDVLGLMDKVAGELFLVIGTLAIAIFSGWKLRQATIDELQQGASPFWRAQVPNIVTMLRFVVPVVVVIVLWFTLLETVEVVQGFIAAGE